MNKSKITNIVLAGVGGQGIILAGKILAEVAFRSGLMVKSNELHGMAQRGGSVISHVRFGPEVSSPLVSRGQADYLVALEELEGLRQIHYLKPGGTVVLNKRKVIPAGLDTHSDLYPQDVPDQLISLGYQVKEVPAFDLAKKIGTAKVENVVLLGALSSCLSFSESAWAEVIKEAVPAKTIEMNLAAFQQGRMILSQKNPA